MVKLWFKKLLGLRRSIALEIKLSIAKLLKGKDIGFYFQEIFRNTCSADLRKCVDEWLSKPTEEWYPLVNLNNGMLITFP